MRPGLSVHYPLHTGAFRCTSIPGNDRRTNGVRLCRNLPYAACIRMDCKYDQPALFPVYLLFILILMFVMHEKNLKADSKKTAVAATFHGSHGCFFYHDSFPKICSTISSCFFSRRYRRTAFGISSAMLIFRMIWNGP